MRRSRAVFASRMASPDDTRTEMGLSARTAVLIATTTTAAYEVNRIVAFSDVLLGGARRSGLISNYAQELVSLYVSIIAGESIARRNVCPSQNIQPTVESCRNRR